MSTIKFILYFALAFVLVRYLMRLMYPPPSQQTKNKNATKKANVEELEKPKFTIEAESVDFEIIEEPKEQNEK